jgi:hypothetical protein
MGPHIEDADVFREIPILAIQSSLARRDAAFLWQWPHSKTPGKYGNK